MKYLFSISILCLFLATSCEKTEPDHSHDDEFKYTATIEQPNTEAKKMGQMLDIKVNFESETGKAIHHVNVKITKKDDDSVVLYNQPDEAHVHEMDGKLEFTDSLMLSTDGNFEAHSNYVISARVWGHDAGQEEVTQSVEFHVHPE